MTTQGTMMKKAVLTLIFILAFAQTGFAEWPQIHGFVEMDYGVKVSDDNTKRDNYNLFEQRLQLRANHNFSGDNYLAQKGASLSFKGDFTVDEYYNGKTGFELRELNLALTPMDIVDLKIGRQALTWGTGELLFINDMFPKDYVSFLIGRDNEYLKKPSDAVKVSIYPKFANIDLVAIPHFAPNTIPKGDRLSFFDTFQKGIAGVNSERRLIEPPFQMSNNEYALRVYRNFGSNEAALYFFHGFDKNPRSYKNQAARELYYEPMDVYGGSLRGPFASGIGNIEVGYIRSRDDSKGNLRTVENSSFKTMMGYSKDLGNDLNVGFQYMYEQKLDYDDYRDNLLTNDYRWDQRRHLLTNRIVKLFKNQTVRVSLFTFYSPTDNDGYVRPVVAYDINDQWKVTFGANLPWGEDENTEFGQMKRNKNIYTRIRYSF